MVLVVSFIAFEAIAVATVLPVVVRHLGGLRLYGWAFSAFMLAQLVGIVVAGPLADRIGMPSLSNSLSRRQAYQHAALMGWSALDSDARKEMLALAAEIDILASTP